MAPSPRCSELTAQMGRSSTVQEVIKASTHRNENISIHIKVLQNLIGKKKDNNENDDGEVCFFFPPFTEVRTFRNESLPRPSAAPYGNQSILITAAF